MLTDRRTLYALLITAAVAGVAGRILHVMRVYEPELFRAEGDTASPRGSWPKTRPVPMPSHGDNDRSRWVTVRALVDHGTYVIGRRDPDAATADNKYGDVGLVFEEGWRTIDKVKNPDTNAYFSSKPPLLPTILAGEYWLLKQVFGWSIVEDRFSVMRTILMTVNAFPFLIYLFLLARLTERLGKTDWGRMFVVTAACFGTLLTAFATTLNNHNLAAFSTVFALYPAVQIWMAPQERGTVWRFLLAGFFAGFTAVTELPAAAFAAGLGLALLLRAPGRTLLYFTPAALVPVAALLLTNYVALGMFTPAYDKFGSEWYEYEGSYWQYDPSKPRGGIDWIGLKQTKAEYAFNILLGHHGLFSLSPIYLLAVAGMLWGLFVWRRRSPADTSNPESVAATGGLRLVAVLTLALTVVVVGFYIVGVGDRSRNYGGWTSGLRWLMWLTPLWLVTMLPAADWLAGRRWGRVLACLLLAGSVLSASYPEYSPWRHPWLYNWMESRGWLDYEKVDNPNP